MVTAGPSSHSNSLLRLLISLLEVLDAVKRWMSTTWYCLTHGIGPAKAGGTNPPPPAVVGIIIAEPNAEDISLQMVANVAAWCMPYDSVHQLHLYEPTGQLKQSQPQLEQKLAVAANNEDRNLVIRCGWSVSKPSCTTPAFEQQQKRQQRLASTQKQQSAHPTQQRSWGLWLTQQIVGTDGKQQDATSQLETSQGELMKDTTATRCANQPQQQRVGCSSGYSTEWQETQAEAISTDVRAANAGGNSSRTERGACVVSSRPAAAVGVQSAGPAAAAVTVRILSGEDAFLPVIEAAAERCRSFEPSSSLLKQPHWLQDQDQGPQEQQKQSQRKQQAQANSVPSNSSVGCRHDPRRSCSASIMKSCSCSNGIKHSAETGIACSTCQQQQQCLQTCITPCSSNCFCDGYDDRMAAVAQHNSVQQQQQGVAEPQVVTVADSSIQAWKQQQQQSTCKESTLSQVEQEQCLPCCQAGLAQKNQQQDSQRKVATVLQQQQQQHKPQQKQQGSLLPELAAVSGPDIAQEPQLLLVFGPVLTLAGYPPFHTRAAEVHYMGRLAQANRPAVAGAIARYCKVLQRHGA